MWLINIALCYNLVFSNARARDIDVSKSLVDQDITRVAEAKLQTNDLYNFAYNSMRFS